MRRDDWEKENSIGGSSSAGPEGSTRLWGAATHEMEGDGYQTPAGPPRPCSQMAQSSS